MKPRARWIVAALFAAAIFAASSSQRPAPSLAAIPGLDKLLHFAAFFLFAASMHWALRGSGVPPLRSALLAAAAASLYGASDEIHQAFVPGRSATWADWAADSLGGAALAAALFVRGRLRGCCGGRGIRGRTAIPRDAPKGP